MDALIIGGASGSGGGLLEELLLEQPGITRGPSGEALRRMAELHEAIKSEGRWSAHASAQSLTSLCQSLAEDRRASHWVSRISPELVELPFLMEVSPKARFIHVIRDGRDVVAAILEEGRERWFSRDASAAALHWASAVEETRARIREQPGRCHEVRYERLVTDTTAVLEELLGEIGLKAAAPAISPPEGEIGRWRSLDSGVLDAFYRMTRGLSAELGYARS